MSGLNQQFTKLSSLNWLREFESRSLRQQMPKGIFCWLREESLGSFRARFEKLLSEETIVSARLIEIEYSKSNKWTVSVRNKIDFKKILAKRCTEAVSFETLALSASKCRKAFFAG